MPFLSCSAVKCIYNDDHYCQKGDILVEGNHAQEPSETCLLYTSDAADEL